MSPTGSGRSLNATAARIDHQPGLGSLSIHGPVTGDRWSHTHGKPVVPSLWQVTTHTQLRLARGLVADRRRPWERLLAREGRLSPTRVRRGFRDLRHNLDVPADPPKPSRPGPGRPAGSRNAVRVPRHDPGKHKTVTAITQAQVRLSHSPIAETTFFAPSDKTEK